MPKKLYSEQEKKKFREYADSHAPKRNLFADCATAFFVGGSICVIGQALFDLYSMLDITEATAKSLVSVTLILVSCILTGLGVYPKLAKYAGAGTLVPITGFAKLMENIWGRRQISFPQSWQKQTISAS